MIEVNYGINYDNSQGIQFALANRKLEVADERYPHVVLNANNPNDEINIPQLDKCNLLVVRAEKKFGENSTSKLMYKIGTGSLVELDPPLFLLGTWIKALSAAPQAGTGGTPGPAAPNDLKITFQINPTPAGNSQDEAKIEVAIGWTETL